MKGRGRIRRQECLAGPNDANRAQWKQAGAVGTCVKIPPTLVLKGKKKVLETFVLYFFHYSLLCIKVQV